MSRSDLIDAIRRYAPSASPHFLMRFSEPELVEYLRAAESKAAKRAREGLIEVAV